MKTLSLIALIALTFPALGPQSARAADISTNRPFLAIWRDHEGRQFNSHSPYLRIAIWDDGRIVFAKDPTNWSHELLEGRIEPGKVAELKQAVEKTGVFELKGNCYLVTDAPMDCIMVDVNGKQQMLFWDERETPGYGINIAPKEHHLKFMRCWKDVNTLALKAIPTESHLYPERFRTPASWQIKRPIQSE